MLPQWSELSIKLLFLLFNFPLIKKYDRIGIWRSIDDDEMRRLSSIYRQEMQKIEINWLDYLANVPQVSDNRLCKI
jgi:lipopolysaccharide biosynthesis protein